MRLLASLEDYIATTTENGLQLHQFMPCGLDAMVRGFPFRIYVDTRYPWDGTVTLRVAEAPPAEVAISLRVPDWAGPLTLEVDGEPLEARSDPLGYLLVERKWRPGEELKAHFPMRAKLVEPHPATDAVRGCLALERGPLVYCFEGADMAGLAMAGLRLPPTCTIDGQDVQTIAGEEMVTIRVNATEVALPESPWPYREAVPGPPGTPVSTTPRPIGAVPYYAWDRREPSEMRVWVPGLDSLGTQP